MIAEHSRRLLRDLYSAADFDGAISRCYRVGRYAGDCISIAAAKYVWQRGAVTIFVDDRNGYLTVASDGRLVVSTHSSNRVYIPGPWQQAIDAADSNVRTQ